jgi:hypothetical protein
MFRLCWKFLDSKVVPHELSDFVDLVDGNRHVEVQANQRFHICVANTPSQQAGLVHGDCFPE